MSASLWREPASWCCQSTAQTRWSGAHSWFAYGCSSRLRAALHQAPLVGCQTLCMAMPHAPAQLCTSAVLRGLCRLLKSSATGIACASPRCHAHLRCQLCLPLSPQRPALPEEDTGAPGRQLTLAVAACCIGSSTGPANSEDGRSHWCPAAGTLLQLRSQQGLEVTPRAPQPGSPCAVHSAGSSPTTPWSTALEGGDSPTSVLFAAGQPWSVHCSEPCLVSQGSDALSRPFLHRSGL